MRQPSAWRTWSAILRPITNVCACEHRRFESEIERRQTVLETRLWRPSRSPQSREPNSKVSYEAKRFMSLQRRLAPNQNFRRSPEALDVTRQNLPTVLQFAGIMVSAHSLLGRLLLVLALVEVSVLVWMWRHRHHRWRHQRESPGGSASAPSLRPQARSFGACGRRVIRACLRRGIDDGKRVRLIWRG